MKFKIYTAHQITGLTPNQVIDYFGGMKELLTNMGFDVLQPMTGKGFFRTETTQEKEFKSTGYLNPISTDHAIFERDMWMVDLCDICLLDFTGTSKASIGMIVELARAKARGKQCLVIMDDSNPHWHAFIKECATIVLPTLDAAIQYLSKLPTQEF